MKLTWIKLAGGSMSHPPQDLMQVRFHVQGSRYSPSNRSRREDATMYWDDAVIFGLVTVAMMIAFLAGWVGFIIRDHRKKH
ncbi:cytochrome c oxidase subunit CcoM [Halomonas urumqiensis]|uniref:Uncharacterized protein n=1 Tax=Halomonas urumqiensis TaxID=1684789 RepID=A0A2N7UQX5_9GAMM|nr:cytochrome c oxidase subunit CcoM [Halomonas urumqiensis]PMR82838.1 hypothetical protein C1H70_00830 [Halomonas urumqiensis]PTB01844.1 hypothetical protein C6V82_12370 [Halomonas urumqiensis]